ncbi:MAG: hypothetical protein ACRDZ8_15235 [Acidimicrobiales bacterium]
MEAVGDAPGEVVEVELTDDGGTPPPGRVPAVELEVAAAVVVAVVVVAVVVVGVVVVALWVGVGPGSSGN